jgi:hypothetical protein
VFEDSFRAFIHRNAEVRYQLKCFTEHIGLYLNTADLLGTERKVTYNISERRRC